MWVTDGDLFEVLDEARCHCSSGGNWWLNVVVCVGSCEEGSVGGGRRVDLYRST